MTESLWNSGLELEAVDEYCEEETVLRRRSCGATSLFNDADVGSSTSIPGTQSGTVVVGTEGRDRGSGARFLSLAVMLKIRGPGRCNLHLTTIDILGFEDMRSRLKLSRSFASIPIRPGRGIMGAAAMTDRQQHKKRTAQQLALLTSPRQQRGCLVLRRLPMSQKRGFASTTLLGGQEGPKCARRSGQIKRLALA